MLRKKNSKTKTTSDKISELFARNANGEDESSDEQNEEPRVEQEFDEYDVPDARTTEIRKRNVKLLSEQSARYRGKISSRNELEESQESGLSEGDEPEEEDDYTSGDDDSDEGALKAFTNKLSGGAVKRATALYEDDSEDGLEHSSRNNEHEESDLDEDIVNSEDDDNYDEEEEEEGDGEDDDGDDGEEDSIESEDGASDDENANGTDIISEANRQAEVQKGLCVQNQLQIWERLLEIRIQTQKVLSKTNQLPAPSDLKLHQKQNEKLANVSHESVNRLSKLLSTLLQLQNTCCQQFSEQRSALKKSLKRPLPINGTEKECPIPIKRFADYIDAHFQDFKPYRNAVLLKWDDRTKLLTPGAGVKKKTLTEDYDIIKKIENTLHNRTTLIEKSQGFKNGDDKIADNSGAENDVAKNVENHRRNVELYDDSEFYHQQLRELIEYKSNTSVSASEVTQQFVELQKLRQKMKKKVDTRASKGRKLRYTVHNKLINFMAPDDTSTWTEESKEELYRSLFAA